MQYLIQQVGLRCTVGQEFDHAATKKLEFGESDGDNRKLLTSPGAVMSLQK